LFAPLKPYFRYRHYLVLRWLVVARPRPGERMSIAVASWIYECPQHRQANRRVAWSVVNSRGEAAGTQSNTFTKAKWIYEALIRARTATRIVVKSRNIAWDRRERILP
jgi:hypothetical protein